MENQETSTNTPDARPRCSRLVLRPGNGWKWLGSSVWEHTSGTRIHCLGRVRFADGSGRMWTWPEEYRFMRLTGYNTKRALMVWARSLILQNTRTDAPQGRVE